MTSSIPLVVALHEAVSSGEESLLDELGRGGATVEFLAGLARTRQASR